jgi:hypothetical protein
LEWSEAFEGRLDARVGESVSLKTVAGSSGCRFHPVARKRRSLLALIRGRDRKLRHLRAFEARQYIELYRVGLMGLALRSPRRRR